MITVRSARHLCSRFHVAGISVCIFLGATTGLQAGTFIYEAIDDFPSIDVGEVPYYRDTGTGLNVLAINAANSTYREKFARAERVFEGPAGNYNITLLTLGELDGEGVYRLRVNGELVDEVTNAAVDIDYTEQQHEFANVLLPADAVLAVESLANSNDLIPEGDGFAFARGRWRRLSLQSVGDTGEPTVDLGVSLTLGASAFEQDKNIQITATVQNQSQETVATSPQLVVTLPAHVSFVEGTECAADLQLVSCALPELAPGAEVDIALVAHLNEQNEAVIEAAASADQSDANLADNTAREVFSAQSQSEPDTTTDPTGVPSTEPEAPATNGDTDGESSSGAFSPGLWLAVFIFLYLRRKPLFGVLHQK
ncbi:MAG: hypothetical protein V3U76_15920 [Granulosicoccus sp.]